MRRIGWWVSVLVWSAAAFGQGSTASLFGDDPVTWTASAEPASAHPGEVVELVLTATIEDPYHVYAAAQREGGMIATSFQPAEGLAALGGLREPQPSEQFDEGFGVPVLYHEGTVVLRQPFRVPASASGDLTLAGAVRYQACTATSCLPPKEADVSATVAITAGTVRAEYAEPAPETAYQVTGPTAEPTAAAAGPTQSAADNARSRGLLAFLLVAFLAGLAALLTPCVFPMVPITVSFFTKQAGDNPRRRIGLAGAYGAGIMVTYTTLGLLLAATMGAGGAQRLASNPVMNLFFAALFIFFALSLFGLFELRLPSGLVNLSAKQSDTGGYLGALFMGLTLTLAAFTCTVQFVGGVLVWAANGEWLWPILGMIAFSAAFALPFMLLALFPQYLASMPKSGGWLETTKIVLGWVEVGAAFKFLSNADLVWNWQLLSRELVLALWAIVALLVVLYLFAWLRQGHTPPPERLGHGRRWFGLMFALLAGYFLWGLTGARLGGTVEALLPPPDYGRGPGRAGAEEWHTDYDAALQAAAERGQNLFVDFTGVTCTNCRWMEQNIFPEPEVAEKLAQLTLVRLYTDTGSRAAEYQRMQVERYHTASLPFYAILSPDGETIATFDGLSRDPDAFAEFLTQGL